MPEYLVTGRNASGSSVTERVDATSADEAVQIFRERGYDEIVLHTDDVGARYIRQSAVASFMTPRQFLWFRNLPVPLAGFLLVTLKAYQRGWYWNVAALALLLYRYWEGLWWGALDTALLIYLLFPVMFALVAPLFLGAAGRYNRLIDAVAWGRWDEVLARADSLSGKVSPEEVAFQKAKALAGLGRLDEGLRLVEPFADGTTIPGWLYWSRLASVFSTARRMDDSKAAMEKALALAPDNATLLVDMADSEVWLRRNPRRARELLARARAHAISDLIQPHVMKIEGLIRLEEGDAREARELLETAFNKVAAFRHASPLVGAMLDRMHAALALACAAEGDAVAARRHFQLARPRLLALKLDDALGRCQKALGLPDEH
jgi:tetratricopeptide (TPR) repeat protein